MLERLQNFQSAASRRIASHRIYSIYRARAHTGNQQHEEDSRADPSGRIIEANRVKRAERLLSSGLGPGALSPPAGGQL